MTLHLPPDRTAAIRALNDEFRRLGPALSWAKFDGLWLVTSGIQALGPAAVRGAVSGTMRFDAFDCDNDTYGEHDFGAFAVEGHRIFWKIDYLERGTQFGANDPADNARTCRVITIMRAEDY